VRGSNIFQYSPEWGEKLKQTTLNLANLSSNSVQVATSCCIGKIMKLSTYWQFGISENRDIEPCASMMRLSAPYRIEIGYFQI